MKQFTRKQFLEGSAAGGLLLLLQACGGSGGSSTGPGFNAGTCSATTITANHGHSLTIQQADTSSTQAKTYSIQGSADHDHAVTFSPADLANLKAGRAATESSSSTVTVVFGMHAHSVTVSCA